MFNTQNNSIMKNNFLTKSLCLLAVLLCVTAVKAAETSTYVFTTRTWNATLNANWTCDSMAFTTNAKGMQVTLAYNTAGATSPVSFNNVKQIVVTYGSTTSGVGSVDVQVGSNAVVNQSCEKKATDLTLVYDYAEPQSGYVSFKVNVTTNSIYIKSISITHNYSADAPDISADKMDLGIGLIGIGEDSFSKDTTLVVSGANLTEPIAISFIGSHLSADETTLPAAGGTIHLHTTVNSAMLLSDTVVLQADGVTTKVAVEGKIKQNVALPGTPATIEEGVETSAASVDGMSAYKMGTSSKDGSLIVKVPANTNTLRFYVAAWTGTGDDKNITLSAPAGVDLSVETLTIRADAGITGNTGIYSLDALTHAAYACEVTLSNVTEETQITLASGTCRRFVVWDVKYELGEIIVPDPVGYTVNYRDKAGSVLSSEVVPFTIPEAPVIEGFTFLYWKLVEGNIADGINVQAVYQSNTPTEMPSVVVNPENRAQKLIRDGNVYILRDDTLYTPSGVRIK